MQTSTRITDDRLDLGAATRIHRAVEETLTRLLPGLE